MGKIKIAVAAAFTLVELLVVIGIIAVLISVLLPALNSARQSALTIACSSNLRTMGQALQVYLQDSRGYYPYGRVKENGIDVSWETALSANLNHTTPIEEYSASANATQKIFICPSKRLDLVLSYSPISTYTGNGLLFASNYISGNFQNHPLYRNGVIALNTIILYKAAWMKDESTKVVAFDGSQSINGAYVGSTLEIGYRGIQLTGQNLWATTGYMENTKYWLFNPNIDQPAVVPNNNADDKGQDPYSQSGWAVYRHAYNTQGNFLFGDGHVQTSRMDKGTYKTDLSVRQFHVRFPPF